MSDPCQCRTLVDMRKFKGKREAQGVSESIGRSDLGNVWLADDLQAPKVVEVYLRSDSDLDLPYDVDLWAEYSEEQARYVCGELICRGRQDGPPVTNDGLRALPMASMLRVGVEGSVTVFGSPDDAGERDGEFIFWNLRADDIDPLRRYRQVAAVYRVAHACGQSPTKGVAEAFGVPSSTAGKWVMRSRKEGLLSKTTPGKAGPGTTKPKRKG